MKKTLSLLLLFALLLFCLGGCQKETPTEQPPASSGTEPEPQPEPSWDADIVPFDPTGFTREQMLEDYDYFWETIQQNCPLMAAYAQQTGQSPEQARLQYRPRLEALEDGDGEGFSTALSYAGNLAFRGFGHIAGVPATQYLAMNNREIADPDMIRRMEHPQAASYYKWEMTLPAYQAMIDKTKMLEQISPEQAEREFRQFAQYNLKTECYEEGAYLAVKSFSPPLGTEPLAIEAMQQFCRQNIDAANMILDIRGNGGGSDALWMEGFRPLMAGKDWTWQTVAGYRDTPLNREHWGDWPQGDSSIQQFSLEQLDQIPQANLAQADSAHLSAMDYLVVKTDTLAYGKDEGTVFQGKIWLLVDSNNYSAAESFVQFAQRSGFATVIGNQTKGNGGAIRQTPYHYFYLPNSGRMARFVPFYYFNPDGSCNSLEGTKPDMESGQQDALQVCLNEIEKEKTK